MNEQEPTFGGDTFPQTHLLANLHWWYGINGLLDNLFGMSNRSQVNGYVTISA
jgi:hypothetical protein